MLQSPRAKRYGLDNFRIAGAAIAIVTAVARHFVAVHDVQRSLLSALQQNMVKRTGLVGENKDTSGPHVCVTGIQGGLVIGREIIRRNWNSVGEAQAHETVTEVDSCRWRRSGRLDSVIAISCGYIRVSCGIRSESRAGSPNAVALSIR